MERVFPEKELSSLFSLNQMEILIAAISPYLVDRCAKIITDKSNSIHNALSGSIFFSPTSTSTDIHSLCHIEFAPDLSLVSTREPQVDDFISRANNRPIPRIMITMGPTTWRHLIMYKHAWMARFELMYYPVLEELIVAKLGTKNAGVDLVIFEDDRPSSPTDTCAFLSLRFGFRFQ